MGAGESGRVTGFSADPPVNGGFYLTGPEIDALIAGADPDPTDAELRGIEHGARHRKPSSFRKRDQRYPWISRPGPSSEARLRVQWLTALVRRFGAGRVGAEFRGFSLPVFEPPKGWSFEDWRDRRG